MLYSHYNHASLSDEPQTKLSWLNFTPLQQQIDQLAAKMNASTSGSHDQRKSRLATLQSYLTVTSR